MKCSRRERCSIYFRQRLGVEIIHENHQNKVVIDEEISRGRVLEWENKQEE